jgi:hypothetical protein
MSQILRAVRRIELSSVAVSETQAARASILVAKLRVAIDFHENIFLTS